MIWIILFAMVFGSGGSPFVVPKMDKYVKKYVQDSARKKEALSLLKEAKAERKIYTKENKKLVKEYNSLFASRSTTREQFEDLSQRSISAHSKSQMTNIDLAIESRKYITKEEWEKLNEDIINDIEKYNKKLDKLENKFRKMFNKLESKIETTIEDSDKAIAALTSLNKFRSTLSGNFTAIKEYLVNKNSPIYTYELDKKGMLEIKTTYNKKEEELHKYYCDFHFELVNTTTEEEWNKLIRIIKILL